MKNNYSNFLYFLLKNNLQPEVAGNKSMPYVARR